SLSEPEVSRALSYGFAEINGFPKWFWPLVAKHGATCAETFKEVLNGAARSPLASNHADKLIGDLDNSTELTTLLGPAVWKRIKATPQISDQVITSALRVGAPGPDAVEEYEFRRLAELRVKGSATPQ